MPPDEPIELPGLAAHRRGPSAAVCASGHVYAWMIDSADEAAAYCAKCGARILFACPACNAPFPPDAEMLQWVPYYSFCGRCGAAYPWIAADVGRAKRALAEQAGAEHWSDAVKARADELVDDIVADRASASWVVAALKWLGEQGAESATATILDAVERLASAPLKAALRPTFPGQF